MTSMSQLSCKNKYSVLDDTFVVFILRYIQQSAFDSHHTALKTSLPDQRKDDVTALYLIHNANYKGLYSKLQIPVYVT